MKSKDYPRREKRKVKYVEPPEPPMIYVENWYSNYPYTHTTWSTAMRHLNRHKFVKRWWIKWEHDTGAAKVHCTSSKNIDSNSWALPANWYPITKAQ